MTLNTVDRLWGGFLNEIVKKQSKAKPMTPDQIEAYKACFYSGAWSLIACLCEHSPTWNANEWMRELRSELEATLNDNAELARMEVKQ